MIPNDYRSRRAAGGLRARLAWRKQCQAKARAWLNSPEGKAATAESDREFVERSEAWHKALMAWCPRVTPGG